jgi:pilus assembly protein CpaE
MPLQLLAIAADPSFAEAVAREAALLRAELRVHTRAGGVHAAARAVREEGPQLLALALPVVSPGDLQELGDALASRPGTAVLLLTPDPKPETLLAAMRAGVREVVPLPSSPGELGQALARQIERAQAGTRSPSRPRALVLALMSAKGGAGSTFLATSLAAALAARGRRTAVLDLDLAHGDAAVFLSDQPGTTTLSDLAAQHARLDGALLESAMLACGPELRLLPAPQRLEGAMAIRSDSVARIVELAAARFDAVVLDLGRGPDAATLPALDLAGSMQVVAPPTLAGLHGARRLLALLRELDVARGRTRLVVNRVGQPGELTATDLRRALAFEEAREIPDSAAAVASAADHGVPIGRHAPRDPVTRALAAWAEELSPELALDTSGSRSWLRSLGWPRAAA